MAYFPMSDKLKPDEYSLGAFRVVRFVPPQSSDDNGRRIVTVNDFKSFCEKCGPNPLAALFSFHENKVSWSNLNVPQYVAWPDDIIKTHKGTCWDFALFVHYFFCHHHINNTIGLVFFLDKVTNERSIGHAFPMFEQDGHYFIWNYFGGSEERSDINGPFSDYEELVDCAASYFNLRYSSMVNGPITKNPRYSHADYLIGNDYDIIDRHYGERNLLQADLVNEIPKITQIQEELAAKARKGMKSFIGTPPEEPLERTIQFIQPDPRDVKNYLDSLRRIGKSAKNSYYFKRAK